MRLRRPRRHLARGSLAGLQFRLARESQTLVNPPPAFHAFAGPSVGVSAFHPSSFSGFPLLCWVSLAALATSIGTNLRFGRNFRPAYRTVEQVGYNEIEVRIRASLILSILLVLLLPLGGKGGPLRVVASSHCSLRCCAKGASECCAATESTERQPSGSQLGPAQSGCECRIGHPASPQGTSSEGTFLPDRGTKQFVTPASAPSAFGGSPAQLGGEPGIVGCDAGPPPKVDRPHSLGRAPPVAAA